MGFRCAFLGWSLLTLLGCHARSQRATASSARPVLVPAPSVAAEPSAAPAPSAAAPRFRLGGSLPSELPWGASSVGAKRVAVAAQPQSPDWCKAARVRAQGYWDETAVLATLELRAKSVQADVFALATGARIHRLRGTFEESRCDNQFKDDYAGTGQVDQGKAASWSIALGRNDPFGPDRGRLHFEASPQGESESTLRLWESKAEQLPGQAPLQKALGVSDDLQAVVDGSEKTSFSASLSLPERELRLTQWGARRERLQQLLTEAVCEYQECRVELSVHLLSPELTLLVPVRTGEDCGAKCTQKASAQLWTLSSSGFHFGVDLPETDEMPGGLNYGGRSSHTRLCWVEADGKPPLEVLSLHTDTESNQANVRVHAYDPATQGYTVSEPLADVEASQADALCAGTIAEY
ncbi:MAG: hypothetical protein QM756_35580 [Polyangiaceae bacterium]